MNIIKTWFTKFFSRYKKKEIAHASYIPLKKENDVWKELYDYAMNNAHSAYPGITNSTAFFLKIKTNRQIYINKSISHEHRYYLYYWSASGDMVEISEHYTHDELNTLYITLRDGYKKTLNNKVKSDILEGIR